ncbi:TetR/AcrR family transcriptional regulator [Actinomadura kijaniata]|uniref:TetR/AcrR family transcriptional regulator n=1 Tax=Actinomadura kijaniata TaxID=46161 RepID=UPI003F1DC0A3
MTKTAGRPRSFDRDAALEKALRAFWRDGYEATSIAALTDAMGIRPPSLYAAFGDKRALFSEAIRRYQETYGAATARGLREEPTGRAAIESLLRRAAADYTDPAHPPGCLIITAATNCADPEVVEELRGHREASKRAIGERVADDVRAGRLPADTDVTALATYYAAVVQGMSRQAQDGARREDLEKVAALAMRAYDA